MTISLTDARITPEAVSREPGAAAGRYVVLSVADTGVGMSSAIQARIFEPFFTTKPPGEGTGLGLSTCYGIVKQAGGYIRVESAEGSGSTFHVHLPAVESESPRQVVAEATAPAPGGSETILIAEDEPAIRAISERVLRERGYTVHTASDGAEALEVAERLRDSLDLLLTDVIMPGLRGRDLAQLLLARRPSLKVLYVSGYGQDNLQGQIPDGLHFLSKPFGPEALARKVRDVLDGTA